MLSSLLWSRHCSMKKKEIFFFVRNEGAILNLEKNSYFRADNRRSFFFVLFCFCAPFFLVMAPGHGHNKRLKFSYLGKRAWSSHPNFWCSDVPGNIKELFQPCLFCISFFVQFYTFFFLSSVSVLPFIMSIKKENSFLQQK